MQMLGRVTPEGTSALRRIISHRKESRATVKVSSLEAWTGPIGEKTVNKLLLTLATPDVLEAARNIPDEDLSIREDNKKRLAAEFPRR